MVKKKKTRIKMKVPPHGELLLKIYSTYSVFKLIYVRLFFLGLAIYAASHYEENKPVVAVIVAFFLFMILLSGLEYLNIYDDRFELVNKSMVPYFTKRRTFYYDDIKEVEYNGNATVLTDMIFRSSSVWNKLFITLKSEEVKSVSTYMYIGQLKEATLKINQLIKSRGK